ncbi:M28 family peptidase [Pedobacter sp. SYSU D00535]|uniref:M28 family peptidase n=1 Tax=Pedobacter sp. SYSU D00535 TaxID=2810308 RepID=UPI001A9630BB|nr:M28 family peptidase [Pedobacter sp. SYSU D00535]
MQYPFQAVLLLLMLVGCSKSIRPQQLFDDVKELSSDRYEGRKTGTAGNKMAIDYISSRFRQLGLKSFETSYAHDFRIKGNGGINSGTNLIAYLPGKTDEAIVITAHFDHVGKVNGQIYNGADDNASGVAGLLALATYFSKHPPQHTLVFAALDAEEMGLLGARAFVEQPPLPIEKIKLNVNMDMISRSESGELFAAGSYHYPELKKYLFTTNSKIKLMMGHDHPDQGKDDWTNQSDHFAFHQKKIPFIYFGVEDHQDYHQPTDDFERIHQEFFRNSVNVIVEVVGNIDKNISTKSIFRDKVIMDK